MRKATMIHQSSAEYLAFTAFLDSSRRTIEIKERTVNIAPSTMLVRTIPGRVEILIVQRPLSVGRISRNDQS